jgi:hypothetical protein
MDVPSSLVYVGGGASKKYSVECVSVKHSGRPVQPIGGGSFDHCTIASL